MELDMITGLGEFLGISMAHQASAHDCYSPNLLDSHQDPIPQAIILRRDMAVSIILSLASIRWK
jgi:hypothetical protein